MERSQRVGEEVEIIGVAASPGIAIGKACVFHRERIGISGVLIVDESQVEQEIVNFDMAVSASVVDVQQLVREKQLLSDSTAADILESHIEFLTDPQIRADVVDRITTQRENAGDALIKVIDSTIEIFNGLDDYMRARAADLSDISERILGKLNRSKQSVLTITENCIIIARDISPSDAIAMDMRLVNGFATQVGSKTSHTALLAKSKGIPAVLGCGNVLNLIKDGDTLILDGLKGTVHINPPLQIIQAYTLRRDSYQKEIALMQSLKHRATETSDGHEVRLLANITSADDMESSFEHGAVGAGLFRTEMLFMNRKTFPSEEEQFECYREVALRSKGKEVTLRTMDIGGDKPLEYFTLPKEENPFLGYRGIRISLDKKDLFITQLRAILRASIFGNFRIMFPMITTLEELRSAKAIVEETKQQLRIDGFEFDRTIPLGIMIEVPSAAIIADMLARESDFFSIGTNDLSQYALAVDRGNEKIKDLYDPFHPAVLRLISFIVEQGYKHTIDVGMCGELASDPAATLLLLGMGLREFSMSAPSIPTVKQIILNHSETEARQVWEKVRLMDNSKSILEYLKKTL